MSLKSIFTGTPDPEDGAEFLSIRNRIKPYLSFENPDVTWQFLFQTASADIAEDIVREFYPGSSFRDDISYDPLDDTFDQERHEKDRFLHLIETGLHALAQKYQMEYAVVTQGECTPRHPPSLSALHKIQRGLKKDMEEAGSVFAEGLLAVRTPPIRKSGLTLKII